MAGENEDLVITIDDDTTQQLTNGADKSSTATTGDQRTAADKGGDKDPVAELKSQFTAIQQREADAQRRADQAARERDQARREAQAARSEVADSQLDGVTSGLQAAKAEAEAAESEYAAAMEKGDFPAAAKAQRKIASAEARIVRLDEAKADIETRKAQQGTQQRSSGQQQQRLEADGDPAERFIASRTAASAQWLRDHPDYATAMGRFSAGQASAEEAKRARKLSAAHQDAEAEGIAVDTPEYFEHLESFIGLKKPAANGANGSNGTGADNGARQPARRQSAPVAPVGQSGGGTSGGGSEVRLTRGEAQAATDGTHIWNYDDPSPHKRFKKGDPIGVQEFARRKKALQAQGAYDRAYLEG